MAEDDYIGSLFVVEGEYLDWRISRGSTLHSKNHLSLCSEINCPDVSDSVVIVLLPASHQLRVGRSDHLAFLNESKVS